MDTFDVLVVREKHLGYGLLIEIDAIIALVGVKIMSVGNVLLGGGGGGGRQESCTAISIEELDFCTTFDHKQRV